jgi:hypothetical protein
MRGKERKMLDNSVEICSESIGIAHRLLAV